MRSVLLALLMLGSGTSRTKNLHEEFTTRWFYYINSPPLLSALAVTWAADGPRFLSVKKWTLSEVRFSTSQKLHDYHLTIWS